MLHPCLKTEWNQDPLHAVTWKLLKETISEEEGRSTGPFKLHLKHFKCRVQPFDFKIPKAPKQQKWF